MTRNELRRLAAFTGNAEKATATGKEPRYGVSGVGGSAEYYIKK